MRQWSVNEGVDARVLRFDGPPPAFLAFPGFPTPAAQGGGPEKSKELAPPPVDPARNGQVQMLLLPHPPRHGASDA